MDDTNDEDEIFRDAVEIILLDVLRRLGNDPHARFALFRRLLTVARDAADGSGRGPELDS